MNGSADITELCRTLPLREFAPGETILEEGKRVGVLYVVEEGTVRITKQGHEIESVSRPGAVFGEISVLLDQPHMATVMAVTHCRLRLVENPVAWLRTQPDFALHLAHLLACRLNAVTTYLIDLKKQFGERDDHFGMVDEVLDSLLHLQARRAR